MSRSKISVIYATKFEKAHAIQSMPQPRGIACTLTKLAKFSAAALHYNRFLENGMQMEIKATKMFENANVYYARKMLH